MVSNHQGEEAHHVKPRLTFWSSLTPRKSLPYDLTIINCPVAVIAGEKDMIIQPYAVQERVSSCLETRIIPEYEHMDLLWADSVKDQVIPVVIEMIRKYARLNATFKGDNGNPEDLPVQLHL